jgi:hypothetical protein
MALRGCLSSVGWSLPALGKALYVNFDLLWQQFARKRLLRPHVDDSQLEWFAA